MSNMSMEIIGRCPYCERQVTKDLRPVNALEENVSEKVSCILKDTDVAGQSVLCTALDGKDIHKNIQQEGNVREGESRCIFRFTQTILDLVEKTMNNMDTNDDHQCHGHAEAVVALLIEEDRFMQQFEEQATAAQAARAKRGARRGR